MENKKHKKKVVRPKNRFTICCFCLNSASSEIDLKNPLEANEACDYVVEKLAIKKVPISLFATDEDLEEMQNMNSLISMGEYRYTPKDKKSAATFSSCYSKIPKNVKNAEHDSDKLITPNKAPSTEKSQENQSINEVNNTESYKDIYTTVSNSEKEIITAEVYSEPSVTRKFLKITPELQETINELGSKQRPTGSPSIKRHVSRPNTGTTNIVSPVSIDRRPFPKIKHNFPPMIQETQEISRSDSGQQKILKQIFSLPTRNEEDRLLSEGDLISEQRQSNEISALLSTLANKAAASQKWKIIIKEHEDEEGGNGGTAHKSTDSGSEYLSETETVSETE